jgi:UDP-N-acetyl-D-glucosamine dehydrogenase
MDAQQLIEKIKSKQAKIGEIGLGYVGLPLVLEFCRAGFEVLGFDIDPEKSRKLNQGESYFHHIAGSRIKACVDQKRFEATTDFSRIAEVDAIVICVPTPLTTQREPDLSFIKKTALEILPHLHPCQLIILESTTYPGTTDEVLCGLLEETGLKSGCDFLLAFSPEREDPGNPDFNTGTIPKVVGGCDPMALEAADALYSQTMEQTVPVSSARAAEAVKLTENIFRCVNIALVNELKMIFARMGIDIWEVIEAARTKPFGFMPFYPGPGLGGHCIPIDPFYLTWKAREYECPTRFIELAGEINTSMPGYVVDILTDALNERTQSVKGSKILIVGVAYKKDVDDTRESPSFKLFELLLKKGAMVDYYDPFVPVIPPLREHPGLVGRRSIEWNPRAIHRYNAAVIATNHSNVDYATLVDAARLVIDSRNATAGIPDPSGKVVKA